MKRVGTIIIWNIGCMVAKTRYPTEFCSIRTATTRCMLVKLL